MHREFWLIKKIKTTGHKNPIQVIDRIITLGLREAQEEFIIRNDFEKLLVKCDLTIVESKKIFR